MDINQLLTFISNNFTPLLTAISVLSFILNIIQYKTNRDVQYHLDSILQSSINGIRMGRERDWSKEEFIHILYLIRIQAVSGLRSIGIRRGYGMFDEVTNQSWLYRFMENTYKIMVDVKRGLPKLMSNEQSTEESKNGKKP
jgi:hypothetical protein